MTLGLILMNGKILKTTSRRSTPKDEPARVQRLLRLTFGRPAAAEEVAIARRVLANPGKGGPHAAWRDLAHVLLCSNEFVYID